MNFLKELCRYFVQITTGIIIICAVNFAVWGGDSDLPKDILWQILLSGAVTAVITEIIMILPEASTKKQFILYTVLHYAVLCVVMSVLGIMFGWASKTAAGVVLMCLSVAVVYAFTMALTYLTSKRDAENLTRLLRSKYKKK